MNISANWIWYPEESSPQNTVVYFRRQVLISTDAQYRLIISADSRYVLYINEKRIGYGPGRAYQSNYEYDVYDVSPYLLSGENVIAAKVIHWGIGTFQHLVGRGGLLLQLENDQGNIILISDSSWKCKRSIAYRRNTPRISCQLGWEEQYDANLEEIGWTNTNFDDSDWENAFDIGPIGTSPWINMHPRSVAFLTDDKLSPINIIDRGKFLRPNLIASVNIRPYIAADDLSTERIDVDAILATVLELPEACDVLIKRCSLYGSAPELLIDAFRILWEIDESSDFYVTMSLSAGSHILLLDWQGIIHDTDITLSFHGVNGMSLSSKQLGGKNKWLIVKQPGIARDQVCNAKTLDKFLNITINWDDVSESDTPEADVYMDISSSIALEIKDNRVSFPLVLEEIDDDQSYHFIIDFEREIIGWIEFDIETTSGTIVDLLGFEGVQENRYVLTERMNNSMRYICTSGYQTYKSIIRRGFRYLLLAVHNISSTTELKDVRVFMSTYPRELKGSFSCSDLLLNRIWEMSAYTLMLCSEDTFTDCPAYEQALWVGDVNIEALVHYTTIGSTDIVEKSLKLAAESLGRVPIVNSQVPSAWEGMPIPNWSCLWALSCWNHYLFTGDKEFVADIYPYLKRQAKYIDANRSDNPLGLFQLVNAWHFIDWERLDDKGENLCITHENCLAVAALNATADLANALSITRDSRYWRTVADELSKTINKLLWDESIAAYVDCIKYDGSLSNTISQPTNAIVIFTNVADKDRATKLIPRLLQKPENWVGYETPMLLSFICEILANNNMHLEMLSLIRKNWGIMLDKGATTAWETFIKEQNRLWTRSWCHGWSSFPAYLLSSYILGIRPTEPGCKKVLIAPKLDDLTWITGNFPTPYGEIILSLDASPTKPYIYIKLPRSVSANVIIPNEFSNSAIINQLAHFGKVSNENSRYRIELPDGCEMMIKE